MPGGGATAHGIRERSNPAMSGVEATRTSSARYTSPIAPAEPLDHTIGADELGCETYQALFRLIRRAAGCARRQGLHL